MLSLFLCTEAHSQLPLDSLKKICISEYVKYLNFSNNFEKIKKTYPFVFIKDYDFKLSFNNCSEIFEGYFNYYRVFVISFRSNISTSGDRTEFPKLMVIDSRTGKRKQFVDLDSFNQFINSSQKEITRLDACYLFMFLVYNFPDSFQYWNMLPTAYPKQIYENSVLAIKKTLIYYCITTEIYTVLKV